MAGLSRRQFLSFAVPVQRPNVLFIFVDDLGYGDLGVTGNRDVPTPNLDRLAKEGMRFTQFYVASPVCSPSRVGVTTGQYPGRHSITNFLATRAHNARSEMRDWLDPAAPSVARAFQEAGYWTGHFGKWHMGGGREIGDAPLPQAYGFAESVTSFEGLGERILIEGDGLSKQSAALGNGKITWAPKDRLTAMYVDRALDFMERRGGKPFYVHLWPCDVHDAHQPSKEGLEAWAGKAENPYLPKFWAVLAEMDRQIGRLLEGLDKMGLAESTLVVLTGDNGPTAWPRYYAEGFPPPGSTGGFRGRKWSLYEGGIRQPLLVRWKGRVPAGRVDEETIVAAVDLLPTFCGMAGVKGPTVELDGEDRSGAFLGKPMGRRKRPVFWEYGRTETFQRPGLKADQSPNLAVRDGRWKLLVNADGTGMELYDFGESGLEKVDVAGRYPRVAERLKARVLAWRWGLPGLG